MRVVRADEVSRALDVALLVEELRVAFVTYSLGGKRGGMRGRSSVGDAEVAVSFPGVASGVPAFTIATHVRAPGAPGAGHVLLYDAKTGAAIAALDGPALAERLDEAAVALAADVLAPDEAASVAVVGATRAGEAQLAALARYRKVQHARVADADADRAREFADRAASAIGAPVELTTHVGRAVADADVVLVAHDAREPEIFRGMVKPGAHVSARGAAVDAGLLRGARVVAPDRDAAARDGPVAAAGLARDAVAAELGEVISGLKPARAAPGEVTVFAHDALPFLEASAAWLAWTALAGGRA